jgi:hypothetical protein
MIVNMLRLGLALFALCGTALYAQSVLSARAGLLHYVEGEVLLDGKPAEVDLASFPSMKTGSVLRTADGRAEVLLNPGVFLRMAKTRRSGCWTAVWTARESSSSRAWRSWSRIWRRSRTTTA